MGMKCSCRQGKLRDWGCVGAGLGGGHCVHQGKLPGEQAHWGGLLKDTQEPPGAFLENGQQVHGEGGEKGLGM